MAYPKYTEVEDALLQLLYTAGGPEWKMKPSDTYGPLASHFGLTDSERTQTRHQAFSDGRSELAWNNRVQFARRKLKTSEYLSPLKGFWKLSEKGARRASNLSHTMMDVVYPDEIAEPFVEGLGFRVSVNAYERSKEARQKCIDHYGLACSVCDFDFAKQYGDRGKDFIHVHHLTPISQISKSYVVDPVVDLRPVCPNCHSMLHRTVPPCSLEDLKEIRVNRK